MHVNPVLQDMAGGNLTLWEEQGLSGRLGDPTDSIHPVENLLVSFRGDAPHRCRLTPLTVRTSNDNSITDSADLYQ